MSYTLKGRIESRLGSAVPALVVALALHRWWAIELVALMLAIGLVLDVVVYHRALAYQPGCGSRCRSARSSSGSSTARCAGSG